MPTINSTIGGEYANSYLDVSFADDYFLSHWDSIKSAAWDLLDDSQKQQLLILACSVIETARFTNPSSRETPGLYYDSSTNKVLSLDPKTEPVRYYSYQALQFPRNLDRDMTTGALYIPEKVKMAQCEQAIYLNSYDPSAMANRLQGVVQDRVSLGSGQVTVSQQYVAEGSSFAPLALEYVRPFLISKTARLRRA